MADYCKGCPVELCFYIHLNTKGDCPCTNCLVKVVCNDGVSCSQWREHTKSKIGMKIGKVKDESELL